jgi:ribosomal protein S18 acetylase RimI-like enzyme
MEIDRVNIRNYQSEDRKIVREISVESSIFSEFRDAIFSDDIIADLLTLYFTDYEPQSCFVAEKKGQVIGYVLGTKDIRKMRKSMKYRILPGLARKVISNGHFLRKNNFILMKKMLSSLIKGEFKVPDFASEYPATLHINIKAQYRGHHLGSLLVDHFLDCLKKNNIHGIHFGVLSEGAKRFFLKLNFEILFEGEYTFLRYLTGENFPHYIMGKHI